MSALYADENRFDHGLSERCNHQSPVFDTSGITALCWQPVNHDDMHIATWRIPEPGIEADHGAIILLTQELVWNTARTQFDLKRVLWYEFTTGQIVQIPEEYSYRNLYPQIKHSSWYLFVVFATVFMVLMHLLDKIGG